MSPPRPLPAKFRLTRGFCSRLRTRVPGMLYMLTASAPSHTNHTGAGTGAPPGVTEVSQTTVSSRRWTAARAPNSVPSSITRRSYGQAGHADLRAGERGQLLRRDGRRVVEALGHVAADRREHARRRGGLHALGHDAQPERLPER